MYVCVMVYMYVCMCVSVCVCVEFWSSCSSVQFASAESVSLDSYLTCTPASLADLPFNRYQVVPAMHWFVITTPYQVRNFFMPMVGGWGLYTIAFILYFAFIPERLWPGEFLLLVIPFSFSSPKVPPTEVSAVGNAVTHCHEYACSFSLFACILQENSTVSVIHTSCGTSSFFCLPCGEWV